MGSKGTEDINVHSTAPLCPIWISSWEEVTVSLISATDNPSSSDWPPGKGVLGARRIERKGLWCEADVEKGVGVKGSQNTQPGLAHVLIYAPPALARQCWPHPHTCQAGGCTGLESPCGQTGDGQRSQDDNNTAWRAHTDTVVFGGVEWRPKPLGLESQYEACHNLYLSPQVKEQLSNMFPTAGFQPCGRIWEQFLDWHFKYPLISSIVLQSLKNSGVLRWALLTILGLISL